MTDLEERFRGIDRLSPPDLWGAARQRALQGARSPDMRQGRRFAIIAASLAIGLTAVAVVAIAFGSGRDMAPVTPGPIEVENGDIWVQVGGGGAGATAIWRVDPDGDTDPMWSDSGGVFGGAQVEPALVADDYAFSPDGTRVAFSAQVRQGQSDVPRELFVMDADGTEVRQLTSDGAYAGFPAWSPDGRTIVYASYQGTEYIPGCLGLAICRTDLYQIDATGGSPSPLVDSEASETTPAWSPDGSRLAYAEIGEEGSGTIVTVAKDGSARIEVSPRGNVSFPSWSPDGNLILFMKSQEGTNHVWTAAPDGSSLNDVVDTRTDTNFGRPLWSPDGTAIAFARPYAGVVSIWLMDMAGDGSRQRIAGWPGFDAAPVAWRPATSSTTGDAVDGAEAEGEESSQAGFAASVPDLLANAAIDQGAALAIDYGGEPVRIDDGGSRSYTVPTGTRVLISGTPETIAWGWGTGPDPYDKPVPVARQIPIVVHANDGAQLQLRLQATWTDGTVGEWTLRFTVRVPPRDELVLACAPKDRSGFDHRGPSLLPGSDLFIRANLEGVTDRDAVAQVTWPEGSGSWNGTWVIYREGALVAFVNYENLSGTACDGTGIGGV